MANCTCRFCLPESLGTAAGSFRSPGKFERARHRHRAGIIGGHVDLLGPRDLGPTLFTSAGQAWIRIMIA
jgi:hypothetical protein